MCKPATCLQGLEERFLALIEPKLAAALSQKNGQRVQQLSGMLLGMESTGTIEKLYNTARMVPLQVTVIVTVIITITMKNICFAIISGSGVICDTSQLPPDRPVLIILSIQVTVPLHCFASMPTRLFYALLSQLLLLSQETMLCHSTQRQTCESQSSTKQSRLLTCIMHAIKYMPQHLGCACLVVNRSTLAAEHQHLPL